MDYGSESGHSKSKVLVLLMVVAAIILLGAVAYIGFTRRAGGGSPEASLGGDLGRWCALRSEWASKVNSLEADILLKSVRAEDEKARKALQSQRGRLCQEYAEKVRKLTVTDPRISQVEVALVKEGKVRANVSVEIANALSSHLSENIKEVRQASMVLSEGLVRRIQQGKASADNEVATALGDTKACSAIYRGPMTDAGTSDDPYVSWRELDMRRKQAFSKVEERIKELEPREQFANQIYHELVRKYRKPLKKCYSIAKRRQPKLSAQASLLVRLKGNGQVKSMGIAKMEVKDPKLLDCLLAKASKWKLPAPVKSGDHVIITLNFGAL
ncbi:MAG: AgmX/PglI C-terminal domain-containing protein [Deltaproteobacteria bacterium]|nr:AgmX/PglI C-terminal domain-containing protein [Deltaproteobacteria bacterium]